MPAPDAALRQAIRAFDFETAFNEIGWDHLDRPPFAITIGETAYTLDPVAEKRGLQVYAVQPGPDGGIPDRPTRQKLDRRVLDVAREHVLIYADAARTRQVWQWVDRAPGKPVAYREHPYHRQQDPEGLVQKLHRMAVAISEEDTLTLPDMVSRTGGALDKDQVTKKFYREFDAERKRFLAAIRGIAPDEHRTWYASVLLNRLMFLYFIQQKGWLDGHPDYLRDRLRRAPEELGPDRFHSFYRSFLLALFHDALARGAMPPDMQRLIGDVPYLNGGLFDPHEVESLYGDGITIPDAAFDAVFGFFDRWDWTLDYRELRSAKEINPDVLGYIFEQTINDRADNGAYYTKEDITGYIVRSTLIPWLLEEAARGCRVAFDGPADVWHLLADNPDDYLYGSLAQTARDADSRPLPFPPEIAAGLDDVTKRGAWNAPAPDPWGLPTETWREAVARRQRYDDVRARLAAGEVRAVQDLVTLNLDVEQFALDVVQTAEGPDPLRAVWKALRRVAVLDPTCGSGAFLFAALERLEPLYTACLERMQAFVDDHDAHHGPSRIFSDFREELAEAYDTARHPNARYFVLKRLLLENLYGVDIMPEAVEICKLRLFLKLAAQIEDKRRLEPLPDLDFNVRAGNALVGYATRDEVRRALTASRVAGGADQGELLLGPRADALAEFEAGLKEVRRFAERFREQQTEHGGTVTPEDKKKLRDDLRALADTLDRALAAERGVDPDGPAFAAWRERHRPFHWFAEFFGVMERGGFEVTVGNPPYVRMSKITDYTLHSFEVEAASDLYAFVVERCLHLGHKAGRQGMIVMHSLAFSRDFVKTRALLRKASRSAWFSFFARIPSGLFSGDVRVRNCIYVLSPTTCTPEHRTTRIHRWNAVERPALLELMGYVPFEWREEIPMFDHPAEGALFGSPVKRTLGSHFVSRSKHPLYFKQSAYNWIVLTPEEPPCYDGAGRLIRQTKQGTIYADTAEHQRFIALLGSGRLFFAYWLVYGDEFDVTRGPFESFPLDLLRLTPDDRRQLLAIYDRFAAALEGTLQFKLNAGKRIGSYNTSRLWPITDESDAIFARVMMDNPNKALIAVRDHVEATIKTVLEPVETDS